MFSKFYIKFNYENIVPFNLKKKKLRVHANLIANKAVAAQGFFFGVKIKFWYYYYGINGLKKDNILLIKNSLNKKLSVFFISNFNMIEGRWALPKVYEEYYQRYWFLKKRKINTTRIYLSANSNKINYIMNFNIIKLINNNYNKLKYMYNIKNIDILKINYKNKFYNKFLNKNYIPIIYNYKKKIQNLKKNNILIKKNLIRIWNKYNLNNILSYVFHKEITKDTNKDLNKDSRMFVNVKKKYLLKHYLFKALINIKQFLKIYKILNQSIKKNILYLFYKLFFLFRFLKIYKNSSNKILNKIFNKNILKLFFKQQNLRKKNNINYMNIMKKKLKYTLVFKLFYNKFLKKKKKLFYNKFIKVTSKKYNNVIKKNKKKTYYFYNNFHLLGKSNFIFIIKNKKIKRLNYKKIKRLNFKIKALFFRKKINLYTFRVKKKVMVFLNSRNKKNIYKNQDKKYNIISK